MASVEVTISGVLYDKTARTTQPVVLIGEATLTGLGVGGGPIIPPGSGGSPPGIWGPNDPRPTPPIAFPPGWVGGVPPGQPPGIWGPNDPRPTPPIFIPPNVPPSLTPPEEPQPGDPTTIVEGNFPVQPIEPPPYIVMNYPGIGPVVVAPPAEQEAQPQSAAAPKK